MRRPLIVAGIIFLLFAVVHIIRLTYHWEIMIAGYMIPMYVSVIALIIAILLAIWMFTSAARNR